MTVDVIQIMMIMVAINVDRNGYNKDDLMYDNDNSNNDDDDSFDYILGVLTI